MKKLKYYSIHIILFVLFFLTFFINPIFASEEIIHSIDDLNNNVYENYSFRYKSANISKDNILILYKEDSENNIENLELKKKDFLAGKSIDSRLDLLTTSGETSTDSLINQINENENVKAVDYNDAVSINEVVNDPYFSKYQKTHFLQVKADKTVNLGHKNLVKVAVLDTGIDSSHKDLQDRFLFEGFNYVKDIKNCDDDQGHGTSVSGIISATSNNNFGIAGFSGNSNVKVVPFKVLDETGAGYIDKIVAAINSINKTDIRILNMSFGLDNDNKVLNAAIKESYNNNKIILASSGNNNGTTLLYPAAYDEVISVGAVNNLNKRCDHSDWGATNGSNFGTGLDFMAPGDNLATTSLNNSFEYESGTSFSCPVASSLIALMLGENPELNFSEVYNYLKNTSQDLGPEGYDTEYGYGLIDFEKAIQEIQEDSKTTQQPEIEESLKLSPESLNLALNQISLIQPVSNSNKPIIWSSSNSKVATINNGYVFAVNPGVTTITATLAGTDIQSEIQVTVKSVDLLAISSHCQNIGWQPSVPSMTIVGTTGRHLQLEALRLGISDQDLNIKTQVHVSNIGDMAPVGENEIAGTTGKNLGIEALKLDLEGVSAPYYNIYYRVHVENYGWTDWALAGNWAGTKGKNLQLEAVEIYVTNKNGNPPNIPGNVNWTFL